MPAGRGWPGSPTRICLEQETATNTCEHSQGEGPVFQTVLAGFDSRCSLYAGEAARCGVTLPT